MIKTKGDRSLSYTTSQDPPKNEISVPYVPSDKQCILHSSPIEEVVYGGAKGGGKSAALIMDALAYALDYPGANVYLFRETYPNLEANLIREWIKLVPKELYKYNESKHIARLINGSNVLFRYVRNDKDAEGYQGQEFDYLGVDEATKHTERTIQLLLSCLRSAKGFPTLFRGTCNPGGKGHGHIKRNFVEATNYGSKIVNDPVTGNRRQFIPANVYDNDVLMAHDPNYARRLENLPEAERKAFLLGDWDVFIGQVFGEWDRKYHVIEPFAIPRGWFKWKAMDWGFTKPYCVKWYAIDFDGKIYVYRELYGCKPGQFDVGTQETAREVAKKVRDLEIDDDISYSVADPACWAKTGHDGPSIAEVFAVEGVPWSPADNDRMQGKQQVHMRLRGWGKGKPGIVYFSTCEHSIRTLPELIYDEKKVEDVDTTVEDHPYDTDRYGLMARPWIPTIPAKDKPQDYNYKEVEDDESWMAG
jgi:phage terminase large subunit